MVIKVRVKIASSSDALVVEQIKLTAKLISTEKVFPSKTRVSLYLDKFNISLPALVELTLPQT